MSFNCENLFPLAPYFRSPNSKPHRRPEPNTQKKNRSLSSPKKHRKMAADPSGRRPRYHTAVNDVFTTLVGASNALSDVQRRLDLEFRSSYPDHANPVKLVGRVKRVQEEVAALKALCRDLLAQKQELVDMMRTSLAAQRGATQRLLAASGLPLMTEDDEAAYANLNQVIDEWTAQLRPISAVDEEDEDTNQILVNAIV